jgi:ADP-heptose:LPS heptosyltransferase
VDFNSPELTRGHVDGLVKQLTDLAPERMLIFTSFHQSPLPLALLARMASVPWVGAICEDYPGTLLNLRHHAPAEVPEPMRALSLAVAAGYGLADGDDGRLRVGLPAQLPAELTALIGPGRYVVFHPGAAVPARQPTAERSARMVKALVGHGYRVVITGGPGEEGLTAGVAGADAVDLGGRTSLRQLAAVFAGADVVVVPNTGPAHLAVAVGAAVVSLFAPVVPAARWAPFGASVTVLGDQGAPCRLTRARQCPVAGHPCLDGITDTELLTAVERRGVQR